MNKRQGMAAAKVAPASSKRPGRGAWEYLRLCCSDGHEFVLHRKFCQVCPVLLTMAMPPVEGSLDPEDDNKEPLRVKMSFSSRATCIICTYLIAKTWYSKMEHVLDYPLDLSQAHDIFEAAVFLRI
ncbi:hypothetical protein ACOMHN_003990 [Nucella lapillus]